jgi:hypothetical protein
MYTNCTVCAASTCLPAFHPACARTYGRPQPFLVHAQCLKGHPGRLRSCRLLLLLLMMIRAALPAPRALAGRRQQARQLLQGASVRAAGCCTAGGGAVAAAACGGGERLEPCCLPGAEQRPARCDHLLKLVVLWYLAQPALHECERWCDQQQLPGHERARREQPTALARDQRRLHGAHKVGGLRTGVRVHARVDVWGRAGRSRAQPPLQLLVLATLPPPPCRHCCRRVGPCASGGGCLHGL